MSKIKVLRQDELELVQGGGIVYAIAEFFGYANEKYDQIDWSKVSDASNETQENWNLRD
jgi:hypothetical protein